MEISHKKSLIRNLKWLFIAILMIPTTELFGQLSGTKTIGGISPDYSTITEAVAELESQGVSGPVIFNITDGEYNEQISIGSIPGSSEINTITFQSVSGVAANVVIKHTALTSNLNYVIKIDGLKNAIFRNITFMSGGTDFSRSLFLVGDLLNLFFEKCHFIAPLSTSTTDANTVIHVYPSASEGVKFVNNQISGGSHGISYYGQSSRSSLNLLIEGNSIKNSYRRGIWAQYVNGLSIVGNNIEGDERYSGYIGLQIFDCDGKLTISENRIYGALGNAAILSNNDGIANDPSLFYNNFISSKGSRRTFESSGNSFLKFWYNSFYQASESSLATCFFYNGVNSEEIELKNNIISANNGYSLDIASNQGLISSNYNNIYSGGAYIAIENYTEKIVDLEDWKQQSGQDQNSISFNPQFTSYPNLHCEVPPLANSGNPIETIIYDIDGDFRDETPSIGADEFITEDWVPLSGEYSIDPLNSNDRNFKSFSSALGALTTYGISESVIFKVAGGKYNEQITIPYIPGSSELKLITFEPAFGENVELFYESAAVEDNFVINFSNARNTIVRDITIAAKSEIYSTTIKMRNSVENVWIDNSTIFSPVKTLSSSSSHYLIDIDIESGNNIKITDNNLISEGRLINFISNYNLRSKGTIIQGNRMKSTNLIWLNYLDGLKLHNNILSQVKIHYLTGQLLLTNNQIRGGLEIVNSNSDSSAPSLISNNFVYRESGSSAFELYNSSYFRIYFNNFLIGPASWGVGGSAFHYKGSSEIQGNELLNNNFVSSNGPAIDYESADAMVKSNFNNYYTGGDYLAEQGAGLSYKQIYNLLEFQNLRGTDENSLNFNPLFKDNFNLHINEPLLFNAGTPLPEVPEDIDEELRDESPTIGADEYSEGYIVNIQVIGDGYVKRNPDLYKFNEGSNVALTAIPDYGFEFQGWEGDVMSKDNPLNLTMDSSKNLTAIFRERLDISSIVTNASCAQTSDGSIILNITGGTSPYTYDWDNDGLAPEDTEPDSKDLLKILPGFYKVIVSDANNISEELIVEVKNNDEIYPTIVTQENITVLLDVDGVGVLTVAMVDNGSYDNCDILEMKIDTNQLTCEDLGENVVNFTVTDSNSNSSTSEVLVIVSEGAYNIPTYYLDNDGDSFGVDNPNTNVISCIDQGENYSLIAGDCDDSNGEINPDATEVCDEIDNNCNNEVDEGLSTTLYYLDSDGDNYGVDDPDTNIESCLLKDVGYTVVAGDCDDSDKTIYPGATETANDGIDQNCDGQDLVTLGNDGCSADFWENRVTWCTSYNQQDDFYGTFGINNKQGLGNLTLLSSLDGKKGEWGKLAQQATAAILNSCDTGVLYSISEAEIISRVQAVFDDATAGRNEAKLLRQELEAANNAVCPLNQVVSDREGCSVDYWVNSGNWCAAYQQGSDFHSVFGIANTTKIGDPALTLQGALSLKGGGYNKLAKEATAALLNACHPDVDFPLTVVQIIEGTKELFDDPVYGNKDANDLSSLYADANNAACPLSATTLITGASEVYSIELNSFAASEPTAYPNPLQEDGFWLSFPAELQGQTLKATMYDYNGRFLISKDFEVPLGGGDIFWNLDHSEWDQGIYILKLQSAAHNYQIQLMKN